MEVSMPLLPRAPIREWTARLVAPIARQNSPLASLDLFRIARLLPNAHLDFSSRSGPEAHFSIATEHPSGALVILRAGMRGEIVLDEVNFSPTFPVYEIAQKEGGKTEVLLRWGIIGLGIIAPELEILRIGDQVRANRWLLDGHLSLLEDAQRNMRANINNPEHFFMTIPSKNESRVFFNPTFKH
jgi:hypothetical protein